MEHAGVPVPDRYLVIALAAIGLIACTTADPLPGYRAATTEERIAVVSDIERYFALRERLAVSGDVTALYGAYPDLTPNVDRRVGVNNEGWFAERARSAREQPAAVAPPLITQMSHELEYDEPIRVYVSGIHAVAFVHGLEHFNYLADPVPSAGEIFIRFDLRRERDRWQIERTDEQLMHERPPATPRY
jgi:hypothetical protein